MVTTTSSIEKLHFDHRLWMNELSFFSDELRIYERRLEDLVNKNNETKVLSLLEQFQNQFIRQREVLEELHHNIKVHEQKIGEALRRGEEAPLDPNFHDYMKGEMESYRNIYRDLKRKFYSFLARYL
ncbi:MAG: hypothetical protein RIC19_01025 [Phaeodactylibacter sp.]|uniref:hypothetical protein n=1 Tax=Phaeodactylibacter sp. TaxID=1940289 RepID=UPI0032EFDF32